MHTTTQVGNRSSTGSTTERLWKTPSSCRGHTEDFGVAKDSDPEPHPDCANSRGLGVKPTTNRERRDRPMPIVPTPAAPALQAPPALVDGCPECVENVEPPRSVIELVGGFRAAYLCTDCGHAWTTDWRN